MAKVEEAPLLWYSKHRSPVKNVFSMGEICCPVCDSKNVETSGCYTENGFLSDRVKLVKCRECEEVFISIQLRKHE